MSSFSGIYACRYNPPLIHNFAYIFLRDFKLFFYLNDPKVKR
jgi:hypothetical protein